MMVAPAPPLARNLQAARKRKGLSQREVAKALGVTEVTISNHERGVTMPSDELVERYAALYEAPPSALRYADDLDAAIAATLPESDDLKDAAEKVLRSHKVRVWLADFRSELTRARASDEEIDRALTLATSAGVLTFYSRGRVRALTEDDAVTALDAIAVPIRAELQRRGRKFVT